ncbi:hypothetical protein J3R82DRAFT_5258 [Butyriboletus roseoflavus]|nr:hypothetical protein J3R82DRAFT_5258 [Butyriboletus roseoflavus]
MYMHFAVLVPVAALAAVAGAAPNTLVARVSSLCGTGSLECCSQLYTQSEFESLYPSLLQLLGNPISGSQSGLVGANCSVDVGIFCTQQLACCTGTTSGPVSRPVCLNTRAEVSGADLYNFYDRTLSPSAALPSPPYLLSEQLKDVTVPKSPRQLSRSLLSHFECGL